MSRPRLPPITFLPLVAAVVLAVLYGVRGHTDAETCANASDGKDKTHEPAAVGNKFGGRDYSSCGGGMLPERIEQAMSDIEDVFAAKGNDVYFGEPVTHLEHALQCAQLALDEGKTEDVIVAALLHDIGHMSAPSTAPHMDSDGGEDVGVVDHERVGAEFVRARGFSELVADLVESHVPAKRFLVATNATYFARLASDSIRSLTFQGGAMTQAEADLFQGDAQLDSKLALRSYDERGKKPGVPTKSLEFFLEYCWRHLCASTAADVGVAR